MHAMDGANVDIPVSKGHLRGRPAHLDSTPVDNREVKLMAEQTKVGVGTGTPAVVVDKCINA